MLTDAPTTRFTSYVGVERPPQLLGRRPSSTPAELRTSRGHVRAIPEDLLRDASRRLGIISLLAAALWVIATVLGKLAFHKIHPADPRMLSFQPTDWIALVCVIVSLALFAYTRGEERDAAFILDIGLGYQVFISLAIGALFHWEGGPLERMARPEISWIGAVILMFAAIVPNNPKRTLVVGLIAASMNPVGMLIARARGTWDFGPASNVLLMHYPDYLLVGVAAVISHVVTKLGQQVTKAREMGSYQVGKLLGTGGMGEVYRATHRMLARPAAIKLIRPAVLGAGNAEAAQLAAARFHREAEAAAKLRSCHTVEIYDFGVTDDDTLYFVMELLDGMDLETLVREHGPVPANRVICIVRQVCESLEEAHALGLVHRDIKPANIHVGRLGLRHDFVKVLDFGLVKTMRGGGRESLLATAAGLTPGTPSYMPPEMALGETVDGRADLYALGCVTFYLLTGQMVFEAMDGMQMIAKHIRAEPDAPSRRTRLPIPPSLDRVVLACLAKRPEDRPRTAGDVSRLLAAIDVEPWTEEDAAAWWNAQQPSSSHSEALAPAR